MYGVGVCIGVIGSLEEIDQRIFKMGDDVGDGSGLENRGRECESIEPIGR